MIPFVRDMDFAYGRPDQVSPLIRRVIAGNPGPFTFTGTGTYLVGHGEVAVIDPGPALPAHLEAILEAVRGERVTTILVTHTHLDHSPLSAALARETGAVVLGLPAPHVADPAVKLDEGHDHAFAPDQPPSAEMEKAAHAAGLDYVHIPFAGRPTPEQARAVLEAAEAADGPVLAFCRSGTRSITAWSLGQAQAGRRPASELIALAADAGYDLSPVLCLIALQMTISLSTCHPEMTPAGAAARVQIGR